MNPTPLSLEDRRQLDRELTPGETVLWTGKPLRSVLFHKADAYAIPFSLLWAGFSIVWELGVWSGPRNRFMLLWGIPFILVGQYMVWGRFAFDFWLKPHMVYAVTSRRVLVLQHGPRYKLFSNSLALLAATTVTTRKDGIGSIDFTDPEIKAAKSPNRRGTWKAWSELSSLSFRDIPDARDVHRLIEVERARNTGGAQ